MSPRDIEFVKYIEDSMKKIQEELEVAHMEASTWNDGGAHVYVGQLSVLKDVLKKFKSSHC